MTNETTLLRRVRYKLPPNHIILQYYCLVLHVPKNHMYQRQTSSKVDKDHVARKLEYSITDETKSSMVATDEVGKESIDASEILERNFFISNTKIIG